MVYERHGGVIHSSSACTLVGVLGWLGFLRLLRCKDFLFLFSSFQRSLDKTLVGFLDRLEHFTFFGSGSMQGQHIPKLNSLSHITYLREKRDEYTHFHITITITYQFVYTTCNVIYKSQDMSIGI